MWTMLEGFQHLSTEEVDALIAAPINITALIGGADGKIDREERNWTEYLMRARTYSQPHLIQEYYRVASESFLEKLDKAMAELPTEVEARSAILAGKVEDLNPILAKLDNELAATLYKSYLILAKETAKASGGFLRIGAVSAAEHQWVSLPMLTPVMLEGEDPNAIWDDEQEEN
jgi:hypothetical protein